ncbi:MAG: PEP-CTERM sorting domain-containing protein [Candidatus Ancaeobacter aquaticus]|nr:PEP-CTERM sorting domain-containing protein [Candidatus Ancaeobacter aquaticus]
MKKIFVLVIAIFFTSISTSYAIYVTEDFQSYTDSPPEDLNGATGGSGWDIAWTDALPNNFICQTVAGSKMGQIAVPTSSAHRTFSGYTGEDITFQLNVNAWNGDIGRNGIVTFAEIVGDMGPSIAFYNDGATHSLIAFEDVAVGQDLLGGAPVVDDVTYTIMITNVSLGFNGTYSVQVSKPGTTYALYNGVKFEGYDFTVSTLGQIEFMNSPFPAGGNTVSIDNIIVGVPEPSTYALFGIGLFGLIIGWVRKQRRS